MNLNDGGSFYASNRIEIERQFPLNGCCTIVGAIVVNIRGDPTVIF